MRQSGLDERAVGTIVRGILGERNLLGRIPEQAVVATIGVAQREIGFGAQRLVDVITAAVVMLERVYVRKNPPAWVA